MQLQAKKTKDRCPLLGATEQERKFYQLSGRAWNKKNEWKQKEAHAIVSFLGTPILFISAPSKIPHLILVVQLLSHVRLFATPWTATCQVSLSFTISQSLLKFLPIESVMSSNHLTLCYPLLLLPSIFPSIRAFSLSRLTHHVATVLKLQLQHQSL